MTMRILRRHFIHAACVVAAMMLGIASAAAQSGRKPAPAAAELAAMGLQERTIRVGSLERAFLVQPPADPSRPAPVLLVLHGGTQSMRRIFAPDAGATRNWPTLARRENALLIVPNAVNPDNGDPLGDNQNWNDLREGVSRISNADDVGFIGALLDWAQKTYRTDTSRVYVTGASNGGMMTFRLLMETPERFAAGAAFVAALPADGARLKRPAKPTPLMIANGTVDPLVQWNGGRIAGNRGETRSVAATRDWWIAANKAAASAPATQLQDRDPNDNCTIERSVHAAGPGGAPLVTVTMKGGGHAIPSARHSIPDTWLVRRFIGPVCRDVEGTEMTWEFLSRHRR
jgi:polyhydroxybutyrate depolymerase